MNLVTNNRSIHITHNMQSNIKTVWFFEFMNLQVVCIVDCGCGYAVVVASDVLLLLRKIFYQAALNRESQDLLSQSQKYMCENADY